MYIEKVIAKNKPCLSESQAQYYNLISYCYYYINVWYNVKNAKLLIFTIYIFLFSFLYSDCNTNNPKIKFSEYIT